MPDYSKGKVYKIVVDTDEIYLPYVGSSCQELSQRMTDHRDKYKCWKNGGTKCYSFDLFDRFGVENCKIILLEEYPCDSRMKLLMKEREWFDKMECCNKAKPFATKEERKKYNKKYCDEHKEEIIEQTKIYRKNHKEQIAERNKIYYEKHKEEIAKKKKINLECNCGSIITRQYKTQHERSQKHQNWLKSL